MSAVRPQALAALARRYPDDYKRIYQSIKDGSPIDEVTVAEWATQWMVLRERTVRPGTLNADKASLNKWIIPEIGDRPLAGLLRTDIRRVHHVMETAGLADSSVQRTHAVLKVMLNDAVEEGHDVSDRTLRVAKPGGAGKAQRVAMTPDQARMILAVAMKRADASRWVAAILQGMRPAEALGLRWSAIDFERGLMNIEWQLKPVPYRISRDRKSGFRTPRGFEAVHLIDSYHLVRPKTAAGVRVVPLVPYLRTELAAWAAIAPVNDYGLVWSRDGGPTDAGIDRREWESIAEEADVWVTQPDGIRRRPLLYECRHTAATLLMACGADETTITGIVGHSKITSTQAYLHTDEARKLAALNRVSTQLGVTL